ncbi:lanthionine synthetase C family protein [Streptomyces sp. NBC_01187]|uniref:lanthionine synthetase C family protein n=1 Tax=Streptomyces sp. NBC_01187 TaxID=2903766 RepID=UPI00386CAA11|nr:lanthionine synthetase C family protein [Streptomyces sp. NBC_01187]
MITRDDQDIRTAANLIADRLASPEHAHTWDLAHGWWPQSLANGAVGVALLHIERARTGLAPWKRAHDWLACAAAGGAVGGSDSHLFYGAPALAFALHAASDRPDRYARALETLDTHVAATVRDRLDAAHARIDCGEPPALVEFDAIRGLSGMAALLMRHEAHTDLTQEVAAYLVRLTEPVNGDEELLPGWWSALSPSGTRSPNFPGGHGNNGMAHGIGGPLAALSLATLHGITTPGQNEAIERICSWLDRWQQQGPAGPWWPYWITRKQLRTGDPGSGPSRPSWCYGTAGLARAQQLAALALHDTARQHEAEDALLRAVTVPGQLDRTTDASLCHGFAGLVHLTQLAAGDAMTPDLPQALPHLLQRLVPAGPQALTDSLLAPPQGPADIGLLEGATGIALALHSTQTGTSAATAWNACFLIN